MGTRDDARQDVARSSAGAWFRAWHTADCKFTGSHGVMAQDIA